MRLSALHPKHLALGATMTAENGWQRPARYTSPAEELQRLRAGCGLCDLSPQGKWDLKGSGMDVWVYGCMGVKAELEQLSQELPAGPEAVVLGAGPSPSGRWRVPACGWVAGCPPGGKGDRGEANSLAVGGVARIGPAALGETLLYRLAEDHALVTDESPGACDPNSAIRNPQSAIHVTDVTSVLAAFCLAGPRSRGLLSKVTSLNLTDRALPPFSCAQAQVAKCHAILARLDAGGMPAYRLFVTRDYAEFVWEALMEAGRDCGVVPVGTEAWRSIGVQERGDSSEPAPDSQR